MKAFSELTSASQVNNSDLLAISQASGNDFVSKKTTVKDVADFANQNLAEEYDSTSTYAVDDFVMYESALYKCVTAVSSAEAFDPTKWTQVVVTDEMGSGGGGGTGGHTIIDENGNSMTARAGLQFVGGANVSDDSTNNRTIVDLASAGGIDGVFIDTENIVKNDFTLDGNAHDWVATEDCILQGKFMPISSSAGAYINADNISLFVTYQTNQITAFLIPIKKGQTISYKSLSGNNTYTASMVAYGIQTGTTHSKFQPVIYSTEEREVGVWTDGKPLYKQSFLYNTPVSLTYNQWINTGVPSSLDIDRIVCREVMAGADNYTMCEVGLGAGGHYIGIRNDMNAVRSMSALTLYYTKASDVAGSGSWTPQGVPTHHYSTDEQIVGTWIDGSTLYEKTIDFGALPNNTTKTVAYNISNLNNIVDVKGIAFNQNGARPLPFVDDAYKSGDVLLDTIKSSGVVRIIAHTDLSSLTGYVTLQYTKTS